MQIIQICPKSFASNSYLLISGESAFAVDPSVSVAVTIDYLNRTNTTLKGILLTHGHFDHTFSVDTLRARFSVPLYVHSYDAPMLTDASLNGSLAFFEKEFIRRPADLFFEDGQTIAIGEEDIRVIHTPGHSRGSCCFLFKDENGKDALVTGDTLFSNSVGRCDLYGGNETELKYSLQKLSSLDRNATIYPGHNDYSTLGEALDRVAYFFDL